MRCGGAVRVIAQNRGASLIERIAGAREREGRKGGGIARAAADGAAVDRVRGARIRMAREEREGGWRTRDRQGSVLRQRGERENFAEEIFLPLSACRASPR